VNIKILYTPPKHHANIAQNRQVDIQIAATIMPLFINN